MTRRLGLAGLGVTLGVAGTFVAAAVRFLLERAEHAGPASGTAVGIRWAIALAVVALGFVGWLLVATTLQLLVDLVPLGRRVRAVADAIAPRSIRVIGRGVATVAATTLAVVPAMPDVDGASRFSSSAQAEVGPPTAHLEPVPTHRTAPTAPPSAPGFVVPVEPPTDPGPGGEVVVRPGEDFWQIAEVTVAGAVGRSPSEREVAVFWLRLMDANRDRLVLPGNPNLLYPGQVLVLPTTSVAEPGVPTLPETL